MTKLIAGYPGIGKSFMSHSYRNVLDLDISPYRHIVPNFNNMTQHQKETAKKSGYPNNPEYPFNFLAAIRKNIDKYDYVLIPAHPSILPLIKELKIEFEIIMPCIEALAEYRNRYVARGNNEDFVNHLSSIETYNHHIQTAKAVGAPLILLNPGQTLVEYIKNTPGYPALVR